jgi:hypothetical protein|tara:strand:- start:1671 stop:1997 length:327 start_codon:yes stop_codon:yes gene_type:complete
MDGAEFPYSVRPDDTPIKYNMNVQDQVAMYKDNEKHQKAPAILPHQVERINEVLGNTFVCMAELRNMLSNAQKTSNIPTQPLEALKEKIDTINELILDIPETLAKIGI